MTARKGTWRGRVIHHNIAVNRAPVPDLENQLGHSLNRVTAISIDCATRQIIDSQNNRTIWRDGGRSADLPAVDNLGHRFGRACYRSADAAVVDFAYRTNTAVRAKRLSECRLSHAQGNKAGPHRQLDLDLISCGISTHFRPPAHLRP